MFEKKMQGKNVKILMTSSLQLNALYNTTCQNNKYNPPKFNVTNTLLFYKSLGNDEIKSHYPRAYDIIIYKLQKESIKKIQ